MARAEARTRDHSLHPRVSGVIAVDGLSERIEVVRDRWGVPHVFATSAAGASFGHGFVHAQDRLFRMEGARRTAAGRLAEVSGASALPGDRLMRRIGLNRAARRDVAALAPEEHSLLEAYARGVNAGVESLEALPPEFVFLGDAFAPWSVEDTMLLARLVAFGFAGNWVTELIREELVAALGPERASLLDPVHPATGTGTGAPHHRSAAALRDAYEVAQRNGLPSSLASNAWAVTGGRSATGRPLLASDPHVEFALPGLFHVAHLRGGEVDVVGAGIPGIPGVLIGHGEHVAWGVTAGMADVSDCYIEQFEASGSPRYRTPNGWAVADEVVEVIDVLDSGPVEERVLITRHGPVVGPAIGESRTIALRSSAVDGGELASPFLALSRAHTLDEANAALDRWPGTTFNFVLASTAGEIGYRFIGEVPARPTGEGLFPQNGATSPGLPPFLDAAMLPRAFAPQDGIVVSANNAPGSDLELGEEWCDPARADRIGELIAARPLHDVESFGRIQNDRYSTHLVRLRDRILAAAGGIPGDVSAFLVTWDGHLAPTSTAAAVMHVTYGLLAHDLTERVAGGHSRLALGEVWRPMPSNSAFAYRLQGMHVQAIEDAAAPWFASSEDRDRTLRGAVHRAVRSLATTHGAAPSGWSLGAVQQLRFRHALDAVPGLGRWWSRGDLPFGGDVNTVLQAQGSGWDEDAGLRIAPGYRQVLDVGDWDRSVFMHPTGTSGIPGHPRYDDCIDEYLAGTYRPLLYTEAAVRAAAESILVIEPLGERHE